MVLSLVPRACRGGGHLVVAERNDSVMLPYTWFFFFFFSPSIENKELQHKPMLPKVKRSKGILFQLRSTPINGSPAQAKGTTKDSLAHRAEGTNAQNNKKEKDN